MRNVTLLFAVVFFYSSIACGNDLPLQPSNTDKTGGSIGFLAYSKDSKMLGTTTYGGPVQLWDGATCRQLRRLNAPGRTKDQRLSGVSFSPDGSQVASVLVGPGKKRALVIWKVSNGKYIRTLDNGQHYGTSIIADCEYSPDGKRVWVADGSTIFKWNVETGGVDKRYDRNLGWVRFRFKDDGNVLAVCGMANLEVYEPMSGKKYFSYVGETLQWGLC